MIPKIITLSERMNRQSGLGSQIQSVIHSALDATPMPAKMRHAIKGCRSCRQRKDALNRIFPGTS
jgi:hypothetical protein